MRPVTLLLRAVALLWLAFLARAEGPLPQPRTALIFGNAAYSFASLKNTLHDAWKVPSSRSSRRPMPTLAPE